MNCGRAAILALSLLLPWGAGGRADEASPAVTPVGSFSSISQDAEHCTGEALDVWRSGASFLGMFHTCAGITGDTITAVATVKDFDSSAHAVAFEGMLSRGMDYLKGGVQAPSKDHFVFEGTLSGDEITGKLTWTDENYPNHKPKVTTLHLRRQSLQLPAFASQTAWSSYATQHSTPRPP